MFGTVLRLLPVLLPAVFDAVKLVEKLFGGGKGSEKRGVAVEIVKLVILAAEGLSGKDLVENEAFAAAVGQIVDGVVAALNATNAFKKENLA